MKGTQAGKGVAIYLTFNDAQRIVENNGLESRVRQIAKRSMRIAQREGKDLSIEEATRSATEDVAGAYLGKLLDSLLFEAGLKSPDGIKFDAEGNGGDKRIAGLKSKSGLVGYRYGSFTDNEVVLHGGDKVSDRRDMHKPRDFDRTLTGLTSTLISSDPAAVETSATPAVESTQPSIAELRAAIIALFI